MQIDDENCINCKHHICEGEDREIGREGWDGCRKIPGMANLKSFPFGSKQKCWEKRGEK